MNLSLLSLVLVGLYLTLQGGDSASNYVIDKFDGINLPFAMGGCQFHSPIGTYANYTCKTNEAGTAHVDKYYWNEEMCFEAKDNATNFTSNLECGAKSNTITLESYCDFEVPAKREITLAPDTCFQVKDGRDVYITLSCAYSSSVVTVSFYSTSDCSGDASYTRKLNDDECKPWLFNNETKLGFVIYAEIDSCYQDSMAGLSIYNVQKSGLIGITLVYFGILINQLL